jgi:hemerythrin-like metal-binding protein
MPVNFELLVEAAVVLLSWSHECIVGVESMDDQHAILMDALNELRLSLVHGSERKKICKQLERLVEFTQMHFENEEQLLIQEGFPGLPEHRAAHKLLLSQIQAKLEHAKHNETVEFQPLVHFLRSWYLDHVQGLDQSYGFWLNERGVF